MAEWEIKLLSNNCPYAVRHGCMCLSKNSKIEPISCQQSTCPKRIEEKICEWIRIGIDIIYTVYNTECGRKRVMIDDGIRCRYCGGKIIIKEE